MGLFFYAFIFSSTPAGLWMNKDLNENYRAQIVSYSVMVPPMLQIVEKKDCSKNKLFSALIPNCGTEIWK